MTTPTAFLGDLLTAAYLEQIRAGLAFCGFGEQVTPQTRLFIKPNLTFPTYKPGVMTSPQAIEAAIIALKDYTPHIAIGDSDSGGYNRFSMDEVYQATGIAAFAERYGVQLINLSAGERTTHAFTYRGKDFSLHLPRLLTEQTDQLISMPVPKVHGNTTVSLSFKNQWGCIPEPNDRLRLHPYFQHVILEVNRAVKTGTVIMDGRYGLNISGPMRGQPVALNWLMVANTPGTAAVAALALMQIPVEKVAHLRYARQQGWLPDLDQIRFNRDYRPLMRTPFTLRRPLTDYPGLIAFYSPWVAYLAYFSPLAGFLHRLLYLVREPFYEYKRK